VSGYLRRTLLACMPELHPCGQTMTLILHALMHALAHSVLHGEACGLRARQTLDVVKRRVPQGVATAA
jgi:hypothetical protein